MTFHKKIIFIFCLIITSLGCFAQKPDTVVVARHDTVLTKPEEDYKREIIFDGKRYRVYNSYLSLGAGKCYNSVPDKINFNGGADFCFHIKKAYAQIGAMTTGSKSYKRSSFQMHAGAGYRKDLLKMSYAAYAGASYTVGYLPITDTLNPEKSYKAPGIYLSAAAYYKVKYDVGIGLVLFADFNKYQTVAGARIELYFSGAYRGKKKGR